ncbi:MAG: SCO family protein [Nitrospirae bacterium]|nr:MAG: SCO family protein [Nitrospirota bacterium]
MTRSLVIGLLLLLCHPVVLPSGPIAGAEGPGLPKPRTSPGADSVSITLPDLELQDQQGKYLRFKSDLISDKLVAITFIYTTCTTICPVLDAIFVRTQELLGNRLERDVRLISLSIDPATDTPPRLKQYAERQKAQTGWTFLTGKKQHVDRILTGLDVYSRDKAKHPPAILIGDGRRGVWRRLNGFPSPEQVIRVLDRLEEERAREEGIKGR